jgi:cell division protein FtsZ
MDNESKMPDKRITVMGVGGGGQNIINRLYEKLADKTNLNLVCVNTDKQLLECAKAKKLLIGEKICNGIGCGGNPEKAKNAAEESRTQIIKEISGSDMLFIIACLGGGTGTGASSVIAQIAQELGIETKVLATHPFSFEGKKRSLQAMEGIEELKEYAQVQTYNNDLILENTERRTTMRDAFRIIDEQISGKILEFIKNE